MSDVNKTEQPTPKKIKDAREKEGNVMHSSEITSTSIMLCGLVIVYMVAGDIPKIFDKALHQAIRLANDYHDIGQISSAFFDVMFWELIYMAISIFSVTALASIVSNVVQVGPYFSTAKITRGMKNIDPVTNAKNLFSKRTFEQFILSVVKVSVICAIAYFYLKDQRRLLSETMQYEYHVMQGLYTGAEIIGQLVLWIVLAMIPLALIDYFCQYHFYMKDQMMSKDEVKREHKDTEGNPEIKSHRKSMAHDLLFGEGISGLNQASAVIRNPTHYAVAIRYMPSITPVPYILALGKGKSAELIIAECEKLGIPQYIDVPLARALYAHCEPLDFVPLEFAKSLIDFVHWMHANYPQFIYESSPYDQPQ